MTLQDQQRYIARRNLNDFMAVCDFIAELAKPVDAYQLTPFYTLDQYTHWVLVYDECGTPLGAHHRLNPCLPEKIRILCQDITYQRRHNVFSWQIYLKDNFTQVNGGYRHKDYNA
jgi:hypothetical protein